MKRFVALMMCALSLGAAADSDGIFDDEDDCVIPSGIGTSADPYEITCLGELDWVSQNLLS